MMKYRYYKKSLLLTFIASLIAPYSAFSATTSGTLPVSTSVAAVCSLSASPLVFGSYDPIGSNQTSPLNATTLFQLACTKGAVVTETINAGLNSANASGTTRAMSDGQGHFLSYEIYSNPGRNLLWSTTSPVQYTSTTSASQLNSIYGAIPAGQNSYAGNYTDTLTVTITF